MGVVFDPRDPNIVYFANQGQHCIYKHDIAAGTIELWAGRKNTAGYLDGRSPRRSSTTPARCA